MKCADVLFGKFPRYVGPKQSLVFNKSALLRHIFTNSGIEDCFTSVYSFPFDYKNPLLDKVYFEVDGESVEDSLKIGQKVFDWCQDYKFTTLVNWSGVRGPHIYPLFTNTHYSDINKSIDVTKRFAYLMLEETGLYTKETMKRPDGSSYTVKIPLIDSKIIGDIRRLTRYPGSRRASFTGIPLPTFCVSLNPELFPNLTVKDIFNLEKDMESHNYDVKHIEDKTFEEFDLKSIDLSEWRGAEVINVFKNKKDEKIPKEPMDIVVKNLIPRPCIHRYLIRKDAPTPIRFAATCELHERGLKPGLIIELFEKLNWDNFNLQETSMQVYHICRKSVETIGKRKMIEMGFCPVENPDSICSRCR